MTRAPRMTPLAACLLATCLAAGCAPQAVEYRYVATEPLKNEQGHVIGHKERLTDVETLEEFERITYYQPLYDAGGAIVGYQEPVRGGAVIRSLDGRRLGARYVDLRSRGSNPGSEGVTISIQP